MYVQITTKCNMNCAHCCFAATRKGEHMPLNIFQKALQVAVRRGDHLTIGGGEPTMHPDFFKYLELAREESRRGNFDIAPFIGCAGCGHIYPHQVVQPHGATEIAVRPGVRVVARGTSGGRLVKPGVCR